MFIEPTPGVGKFSPAEFSSNSEKDPHLPVALVILKTVTTFTWTSIIRF